MKSALLRILLVEDDPTGLHITPDFLRHYFDDSHVLHRVASLDEGLRQIAVTPLDIVLLDLGLPDELVVHAVHEVRSAAPWVPIVVLSGSAEHEHAIQAVRAGAHDYVVKDRLTSGALGRIIRFAIERQKLMDRQRDRASELAAAKEQAEFLAGQLGESRQRLEMALHATKMMLWDWRLASDITIFGEGITELLGYGLGRAEDRIDRWQDLVHPDERAMVLAGVQRFLASPWGDYEDTFRVIAADGTPRSVIARGRVVEHSASRAERMIGTYLDVTERLATERQLGLSQKLEAIGQLAAGIAHEINTPMQYLGDNIAFLQSSIRQLAPGLRSLTNRTEPQLVGGDSTDAEQPLNEASLLMFLTEAPAALDDCTQGVNSVARIVRAMKEFAHPGTDEKAPVDINAIIESMVTISRNEWKYVAEVRLDLDPALPEVYGLAGEIGQVVLNIVVNAAHAIGTKKPAQNAKGLIIISTQDSEDFVEIRVGDNGPGIPMPARNRIFEPYFTTKEPGKGTGQGLAIAHTVVVQKHSGSLRFETEIGRGTTFVIHLPKNARRADQQSDVGSSADDQQGDSCTSAKQLSSC